MTQTRRVVALVLLLTVAAVAVMAQPVRKDAVWARTVPSGTITLDGILNEAAWAKAESIAVQWGANAGDPGSGYRGESGVGGGVSPTDPTNALIKFLVSGNKLYLGIRCNDKSVGGGLFNQFDGFLMNLRDRSKADRPVPPFEYFYGWVTEGWADPSLDSPTALPGFFGWAGGKRTDSSNGVPNSQIWNAVTKVIGSQNDDAKLDTAWVTELEFNLTPRGYDVTKTGGDIVMFNISIYDSDWRWPLDTTRVTGNRTWLQGPWGNASAYSHLRIFANPTVTTSTTALPAFPYDLTVYNAQSFTAPNIDGKLDELVWKNTPSFDIRFGDLTLRNSYKNTLPYRSGQFQPTIFGSKADVLDPADASVKMFFKNDTLYIGVDVRDKIVQYIPVFDRYDGFRLIVKDRTARDEAEHHLLTRELFVRVDSSAKKYAYEGQSAWITSDTIANKGSRIVLGLNTGTTVDTLGAQEDKGYQIEMKLNLRALGYPAGRGDGALFVSALLLDGDSFGNTGIAPYGNRVWYGQESAWPDGPAFAYMDPGAVLTSVEDGPGTVPATFEVYGAYPNPFNPSTTIAFSLPQQANVKIVVYDVLGRSVANRTLYGLSAGRQGYRFDAAGLTSGSYFYQVQMLDASSGEVLGVHSGKIMLVK